MEEFKKKSRYNSATTRHYYPKAFKNGILTPIYKSGSKKVMMNYRGVNTVPNIAKVFDIVINKQMKLIVRPFIETAQHGFLPNRNIETNLMELTTHVHQAFEANAQLDAFYSDVSKAFDHVDTNLQVRKLASLPLSNSVLFWFKSYFTGRFQYVKVGTALSRMLEVTSGVGQGSIKGPLMFVVFFNDSDPLIKNIVRLNFADDKKLAKIITIKADAVCLQTAIDQFMEWYRRNKHLITVNAKSSPLLTRKNPSSTNT